MFFCILYHNTLSYHICLVMRICTRHDTISLVHVI
jgi:hypothetical protein